MGKLSIQSDSVISCKQSQNPKYNHGNKFFAYQAADDDVQGGKAPLSIAVRILRLEYISFLLCVLFLCSLLLTLTVFHSVDTHSHTHAQKKNPRNYSDLRPQSSQVFLLPSTIAVSLCCISTFQSFLTVPSFRIRRLLSSIFVGFFFFDKLYCTVFRLRSVKFVVF